MKFLALLLFISLIAINTAAIDQDFQAQTNSSGFEIAKNWQLLSVIALMISVILVALAYMIGIGFEMPEMKAWAGTELTQIVANAIVIGALILTLVFIEGLVLAIVAGSGISLDKCNTGNSSSCLQGITNTYLDDYANIAKSGAKSVLSKNVEAAGMASRRIGLYCLTIYCLQIGATTTIAGEYVLKSDMYSIVFEYYANLLSSIEAQRFFVNEICFHMGPVILAIGIVGRSFFFTRKLGGLLIAIAVGMMFFLPGMYIFDWVTLQTVVNGDKGLGEVGAICPAECKQLPPVAISGADTLPKIPDVYLAFADKDKKQAQQLIDGSLATAFGTNETNPFYNKEITSCYFGEAKNCPTVCRELPYPATTNCVNYTAQTQQKCAALPDGCKVVRYVKDINQEQDKSCPAACKIVPPLKTNCDINSCLDSSMDCRVARSNNLNWRPQKDLKLDQGGDLQKTLEKWARCELAKKCPASLTAENSCVYVVPQSGHCDDFGVCLGCPKECRIDSFTGAIPESCKDSNGQYLATCKSCTDGCKVLKNNLETLDTLAKTDNFCGSCPIDNRLVGSGIPVSYSQGGCSYNSCPKDYRAVVPRNACESCLFTEESYAYTPPINYKCSELCKPSDNAAMSDPSAYSKVGAEGLAGVLEIQDVSKLLIPAYLLPLFNIVATLVFIKGLSTILGGDIEIPGLAKVF